MKSAGISLQRAMRSLIAFILLQYYSLLFANNVITQSINSSISENIAQVKPAMAIAEGQFSDVEITISKSIKNQETTEVTGITIHKNLV
jgi:lipopolysaccharide export system permease protein